MHNVSLIFNTVIFFLRLKNRVLTGYKQVIMIHLNVWARPLSSAWRRAAFCVRLRQWDIWKLKSLEGKSAMHPQGIWSSSIWMDDLCLKVLFPSCKHTPSQNHVCVCQVACSSDSLVRFIDLILARYIQLSRQGHLGLWKEVHGLWEAILHQNFGLSLSLFLWSSRLWKSGFVKIRLIFASSSLEEVPEAVHSV